jgi:hypothetical protein
LALEILRSAVDDFAFEELVGFADDLEAPEVVEGFETAGLVADLPAGLVAVLEAGLEALFCWATLISG